MTAPEQHLLRSASVSGTRFSAWAVAAMTDTREGESRTALRGPGRATAVYPARGDTGTTGRVGLRAVRIQALALPGSAVRRLPPTHRRQFHLQAGGKGGGSRGCRRSRRGGGDGGALRSGPRFRARRPLPCGQLAPGRPPLRAQRFDPDAAPRHGLVGAPAGPDRPALEIEILEHLSDAHYAQGEMAQSAEMDYKVVELAGQGGFKAAQIKAWTRLARVLAFRDPENCVAVCEKAVEAQPRARRSAASGARGDAAGLLADRRQRLESGRTRRAARRPWPGSPPWALNCPPTTRFCTRTCSAWRAITKGRAGPPMPGSQSRWRTTAWWSFSPPILRWLTRCFILGGGANCCASYRPRWAR